MKFIVCILPLLLIAGCNQGVKVTKEIDGSETVRVDGEDYSVETNEKDGTAKVKTTDGLEIESTTKPDGSVSYKGKDSDGKNFEMQTGEGVDLDLYGLKDYPGAYNKNGQSNSFQSQTEEGTIANLTVFTKDSAEKVVKFYEPLITAEKSTSMFEGTHFVNGKTKTGASVYITAKTEKEETTITFTINVKKK